MRTITLNITRPNGKEENIDVTEQFKGLMNQARFDKTKEMTKKAGRGTVNFAEIKEMKTNVMQLVKEYNKINNEGGEGYIPESDEFWENYPGYKKWEDVTIIK